MCLQARLIREGICRQTNVPNRRRTEPSAHGTQTIIPLSLKATSNGQTFVLNGCSPFLGKAMEGFIPVAGLPVTRYGFPR